MMLVVLILCKNVKRNKSKTRRLKNPTYTYLKKKKIYIMICESKVSQIMKYTIHDDKM